jgi:hypothetical protein
VSYMEGTTTSIPTKQQPRPCLSTAPPRPPHDIKHAMPYLRQRVCVRRRTGEPQPPQPRHRLQSSCQVEQEERAGGGMSSGESRGDLELRNLQPGTQPKAIIIQTTNNRRNTATQHHDNPGVRSGRATMPQRASTAGLGRPQLGTLQLPGRYRRFFTTAELPPVGAGQQPLASVRPGQIHVTIHTHTHTHTHRAAAAEERKPSFCTGHFQTWAWMARISRSDTAALEAAGMSQRRPVGNPNCRT